MSLLARTIETIKASQARASLRSEKAARSALRNPNTLAIILEGKRSLDRRKIGAQIRTLYDVEVFLVDLFPKDKTWAVLVFPDVTYDDLEFPPYDLAYDIAEHFNLRSAEPDIPSNFSPDEPKRETFRDIFDDFPPGCWTPISEKPPGLNYFWAYERVRAREAWDYSTKQGKPARGAGVTVFQPDTGVTATTDSSGRLKLHEELEPGSISLRDGYDIIEQQPLPIDPANYGWSSGHGTRTASAVVSRETHGMYGTAPAAKVAPIRCIQFVGNLSMSFVAAAVDHARSKKARIITMSLGGTWSNSLYAAISRAVDENTIVMAAAGNCTKSWVISPANYPHCIGVAGTRFDDAPWRGSSYGPEVDWSAPAEFVLHASPGTIGVALGQGTSFSVAISAGAAALWLAHFGTDKLIKSLTPGEKLQDRFRSQVQKSVDRHTICDPDAFGPGILNALKLLQQSGYNSAPSSSKKGVKALAKRSRTEPLQRWVGRAAAVFSGYPAKTFPPESNERIDWDIIAAEVSWIILTRTTRERAAQAARLAGAQGAVKARTVPVSDRLRAVVGRSEHSALAEIIRQ